MLSLRRVLLGRIFLVGSCVGMAGLADWLFYGRVVGWTVALFAAALLAVMEVRAGRLWRTMAGRVVMGLAGVLVLALAEEPTVVGVGLMVMGVGTLAVLGEEAWTSSVSQWVGRWALLGVTVPVRWAMDYWEMGRWWRRHPSSGVRGVRWAGLWVVPMGLGVVFVVLFAVANPIVEMWVREVWEEVWAFCDWVAPMVQVKRVVMWGVVGVGVYGILRYRRVRWLPRARAVAPVVSAREVGMAWVVRCLVVFNGVFLVQTVLDGVYLWGGAKLPEGMTYASYAHRGAYPLVATALLAGFFVLLTFRSGGAAHRSVLARRLVFLWIGQNLFLLASTIWRILLYVDVYSLTRLRLAAMVWVGMVGLGFGWIVWKIVFSKSNVWLWRVNVATVIGVLYVGAFVNVGGLIADFNMRHCREVSGEGVTLDVGYMRGLGVEALPALEMVRGRVEGRKRPNVDAAIGELRGELKEEIADWRGWTLRRARIAMGEGKLRDSGGAVAFGEHMVGER